MNIPWLNLNPKELPFPRYLKLVNELSPDEQAELRATLLEDQEDIRIAEERLKNPGKRWSQDELEQDLDLAD